MVFLIYSLSFVDDMNTACWVFMVVSGIALAISSFVFIMTKYENCPSSEAENKCSAHFRKISARIFFPTLFIVLFFPSSKTIAAMYLIPKIVENKQLSQIPEKALLILNKKLDNWVAELSGEKPEEHKATK